MRKRLSTDIVFTGTVAFVSLCAAFAFEINERDLTRVDTEISMRDQVPCCENQSARSRRSHRIAVAPLLTPGTAQAGFPALSKYLSERVGQPFDAVNCRTFAEIDTQIRLGEASMAIVGSGMFVLDRGRQGLVPIAVPVVKGATTGRSYLVVPAASTVRTWADLRGKSIALTDSLSASGRLIPAHALAQFGAVPDGFFSKMVYTHGIHRSIRAVASGLLDAASVDSQVFESALGQAPDLGRKVRVVWRSAPFGNGPVVVHSRTSVAFRHALAQALRGMRSEAAGRRVLSELGFDGFEPADPDQYRSLEAMLRPPGAAL